MADLKGDSLKYAFYTSVMTFLSSIVNEILSIVKTQGDQASTGVMEKMKVVIDSATAVANASPDTFVFPLFPVISGVLMMLLLVLKKWYDKKKSLTTTILK